MRRRATVGVLLLSSVFAAPAASAAPPASCHAKGVAYRKGDVRVYLRGSRTRTYYLCSSVLRRPTAYHRRRIDADEDTPFDYTIRGHRLVYTDFIVKTQKSTVSWVDLRTAEFHEALIPENGTRTYARLRAVGRAGDIAFATTTYDENMSLWYAAPGRGEQLHARLLVRLVGGDATRIHIGSGMLRWRSIGSRGAARLTAPTLTVHAPPSCGPAGRLYRSGKVEILHRFVGNAERFYVCSDSLRRPKRFMTQNPVSVGDFMLSGPRLGFTVFFEGEDVEYDIGWVDLRTARSQTTRADFSYDENALGPDGAVAVRSEQTVYYAKVTAGRLGGLKQLAKIAGQPAKRSLSIHDGRVWWKTADGQDGSAAAPQ